MFRTKIFNRFRDKFSGRKMKNATIWDLISLLLILFQLVDTRPVYENPEFTLLRTEQDIQPFLSELLASQSEQNPQPCICQNQNPPQRQIQIQDETNLHNHRIQLLHGQPNTPNSFNIIDPEQDSSSSISLLNLMPNPYADPQDSYLNSPFEIIGKSQSDLNLELEPPPKPEIQELLSTAANSPLSTSTSSRGPPKDQEDNIIKQVIFIEPPQDFIKSQQDKESNKSNKPKTVIYVFPPMVKHSYNVTHLLNDDNTLSNDNEPKVYYLGSKQSYGGLDGGNLQGLQSETRIERMTPEEPLSTPTTTTSTTTPLHLPRIMKSVLVTVREKKSKKRISGRSPGGEGLQEPKRFRQFNYFSKQDYEDLRGKGRLQANYIPYRVGYVEPPTREPEVDFSSNRRRPVFPGGGLGSRALVTSGSLRDSNKDEPKVTLEFEGLQGPLPPTPPKLESGFIPSSSPVFIKRSKIKFPEDQDEIFQKKNIGIDVIPASLRRYLYLEPPNKVKTGTRTITTTTSSSSSSPGGGDGGGLN